MRKLNNQGFAITGIMYAILVLFLVLLFSILGLLGSRKLVLDKLKSQVANNLNNVPTLVETLKNGNKVVTSGDGLYHITGDEYRYRGQNVNNYIMIGENRYRIIGIDFQGIKIIMDKKLDNNAIFDSNSGTIRNNANNTYCQITSGSYYGCNVYASVSGNFSTNSKIGTINQNSTLYEYLHTTGTDAALVALRQSAITSSWNIGGINFTTSTTLAALKQDEQSYKNNFKIGLLNPSDYVSASLDAGCTTGVVGNANCKNSNWLFQADDFFPWLLNGNAGNTYEMSIINTNGGFIGYSTSNAANSYGVRPVAYLPLSAITASGEGTVSNPYTFSVR